MPSEADSGLRRKRRRGGATVSELFRQRRQLPRTTAVALAVVLSHLASGCGETELDRLLTDARGQDVQEQRVALRHLAEMGPDAAAALPELMPLTDHADADVRRLAGLALGNIVAGLDGDGSAHERDLVVEALTAQLDDDQIGVRHAAAFALLSLDADHQAAQKCLLTAMSRGDGGIIDRLKSMHPPPVWATPTLIDILGRDRRPGIRRLSAVTLGAISPDEANVRDALQRAERDPDDRVRDAAREALQVE